MMINGVNDMNRNLSVNVAGVDTQDISSARLKAMKRSGQVECETCANREYKDGSDEVNVSFKSAELISCVSTPATLTDRFLFISLTPLIIILMCTPFM